MQAVPRGEQQQHLQLALAAAMAAPPARLRGASQLNSELPPTPHCPPRLPAPAPTRPLQVQRNCVVLPCLHFLYCDSCVKQACTAATPHRPA